MWEDRKKQSSCTLESFIKKHGFAEGEKKYAEWKLNLSKSRTLAGYVEKFGQQDGQKKYIEKNKKLSVSVETLALSGKSILEIHDIKRNHREGSKITLETMVAKYGVDEGAIRWQNRIHKAKISSKRSIEYWLKINSGDLELAKKALSDYQRRDKKYYIQKYGDVIGIEKYNAAKRNRFLGGFIAPISKFQSEVENFVKSNVIGNIFGAENNYCVFVNGELEQSVVIPDILIEDAKLIIECYGDYWHCSDKYPDSYFHEVIKKSAKEIRATDEKRINFLRSKGFRVLIIWESDWRTDKNRQIERIKYEIDQKRS